MTMGVLDGQLMAGMEALTRKGGTMVTTSAAPALEMNMSMNLLSFTMSGKRLQGALFGNCAPRNDVPMLLDLYMRGQLMLDELVTTTYQLDDINQAVKDMREGRNLRGLITYG
jgi:S-(hydroxymethyl)glutathione dehydrogenase/alcohol dehydrogenase